jgi:hypothetical protein
MALVEAIGRQGINGLLLFKQGKMEQLLQLNKHF